MGPREALQTFCKLSPNGDSAVRTTKKQNGSDDGGDNALVWRVARNEVVHDESSQRWPAAETSTPTMEFRFSEMVY